MDKNEYVQHGDIVIEDTGYGFRVIPESMKNDQGGCGGGCSGCVICTPFCNVTYLYLLYF